MMRGLTTWKLYTSADALGVVAARFIDSSENFNTNKNEEGNWNDCRLAVSKISRCSKESMDMEVDPVFGESRSMGMDDNDCPVNGVNLDFTEGLNSHNEAMVNASGSVCALIGWPLCGGDILREERNWEKGQVSVKAGMLHVRNSSFDGDAENGMLDVSSTPSCSLISLLPSVRTPEAISRSSKSIESFGYGSGRCSVALSAETLMEKIEGSIRDITVPAEAAREGKLCIRSNASKLQSKPGGGIGNFYIFILDSVTGLVGKMNRALRDEFGHENDFFNYCVVRGA